MTKSTLEMRVLQRGIEILGSELALARRLRVPQIDLFLWLKGTEKPTRGMFLAAVDVLIEKGDTTGLGELHSLNPDLTDGLEFGLGFVSGERSSQT